MAGVDPEFGVSTMRLWLAAGGAAALVVVCAWMLSRLRTQATASLTRVGLLVLGACLGAAVAWAFSPSVTSSSSSFSSPVLGRNPDLDRHDLELRASQLNAQTLAVGSPLACLDGAAGENVEMACEKALFATPATVASATAYVAARLALLADLVAYSKRGGVNIDNILSPLRHGLETDRFGFVAHTLAVRDGCSSQNCKILELLSDPGRIRANLGGQTLDRYLDHYLTVWAQAAESELTTSAMTQPGSTVPRKVVVNADFPSASSIPPVSIMNPEPKGPVVPGAAAAAAANPNPTEPGPAPNRRSRKPPAAAPSAAAPAAAPPAEPVEPVWAPVPATAAVPAPPAVGAPMQLNSAPPPSPPPQANTVTTHTQ